MLKLISGRLGIVPQSDQKSINILRDKTELFTDDILSSHHRSPTQGFVDGRDLVHRSGNQRGPGVRDGLTAGLAVTDSTHSDGVHLELPVALPRHRHVGERSHVVVGVGASQQDLQMLYTMS